MLQIAHAKWKGFDNYLENPIQILNKNQFPTELVTWKKAIWKQIWGNDKYKIFQASIPWKIFQHFLKKIQNLVTNCCKDIDSKVVLTYLYKGSLLFHLQSFIIYKFICTNCKVWYVGETKNHFITRINEYLQKDVEFKIFEHFQESSICLSVYNRDYFSAIDQATTEYQLKM